ncbi:MAG: hypothetical protein JSU94_12800 [Phycisphaerales bacterium]|nr:MAG: hypothetical protein JSU94_12800 [Phycisphaerales bacterium]
MRLETASVFKEAMGMSWGKPCIKILASKPERLRARILSNIEGYPVIIRQTGEFHAPDEREQQ